MAVSKRRPSERRWCWDSSRFDGSTPTGGLDAAPDRRAVDSTGRITSRSGKSMNADDPEIYRIPDNRNTIAEYLLIYSMSGSPGDFDPYVDYDYRLANMVIFTQSDNTTDMLNLWGNIQAFVDENSPSSSS